VTRISRICAAVAAAAAAVVVAAVALVAPAKAAVAGSRIRIVGRTMALHTQQLVKEDGKFPVGSERPKRQMFRGYACETRHILCRLCLAAIFISSRAGFSQAPAPDSPPLPRQHKTFPGSVPARMTKPLVANGYLVSHARTIRSNRLDDIAVTSLKTGDQAILPFWLENATEIRLESAGVTPGGHILLAGSYLRTSEDAYGVNFVSEVDLTGKIVATHDLREYTPERICSASDGTFWTFGQVWPMEDQEQDYSMLRRYSSSGALEHEYLPRATLGVHQPLNYHSQGAAPGGSPAVNQVYLACGDNSVAAYVGDGGPEFTWIEVNSRSGNSQTRSVARVRGLIVTGLALFSEHIAYASVAGRRFYQLIQGQGDSAGWVPISQPEATPPGPGATPANTDSSWLLLGRDGPDLVHVQVGTQLSSAPVLYWSRPGGSTAK